MEIRLSKEQYYLNEDGTFNQKEALRTSGLKAAVCFKDGQINPWDIREMETDDVLVKRGLGTVVSDHMTPNQQVPISIEAYGIPKALCMFLENIGMQSADERSLRYTEAKENSFATKCEIDIYNYWLDVLQNILWKDYGDFFLKSNQGNEKRAKSAIKKIAQENARLFLTIFMPTSLTYTTNIAEINKVVLQMERTINSKNNTEFEKMMIPYFQEYIDALKELKVVFTNKDIWQINAELAQKNNIPNNADYLYKDPKMLELNLMASKNKFSGINLPNEYGVSFHITKDISFAGFAQLERHRTLRTELEIPNEYKFFVPSFIESYPELVDKWNQDSLKVKDVCIPQGQIIKAGIEGTLKDLVTYVGGERACNRAQYEITKFYMELLNEYYDNLKNNNSPLADELKPYVGMYRCRSKNYRCPSPCFGGPRVDRKF